MFDQLDQRLQQAITEAGFSEPTEVQAAIADAAFDGEDLLVSAKTGSGKTAGYLLPILEHLLVQDNPATLALVLVPTRELAQQVLKHAKLLARFTQIKLGLIGGGTDIKKQNAYIKEPPQLLVATPGRLSELLAKDMLDLSSVQILILDEADRLLDMGFADEVMAIAAHCSQRHQTALFSATLANKGLRGLAHELMPTPQVFALNQVTDSHDSIAQQIVFADDKEHKVKLLLALLQDEANRHCLVFCNSKDQANRLYGLVHQQGISCAILHGDRDQKQRNYTMSKLRRNEVKVLIATDIAARGIDIEGMDLVVNFEVPRRAEIYVHRVGRTGRAGESGVAITLVSAPEYNLMAGIERYLKQTFKRRKIEGLIGHYRGPKKLKSSGKAAGSKKKKTAKKADKKSDKKTAKKSVKKSVKKSTEAQTKANLASDADV